MAFDEQISEAFATLTERLRGEIDQEVRRRTAEIAAAAPAPAVVDADAAIASSGDDGAARLTEAVRSIDAARTLTEVLDALLAAASAESPDAAIWLLRGGALHRWRAEEAAGRGVDAAPAISDGVPLTISGQAVGVLVANSGLRTTNDEPRTTNVEFLARYAARSLEALTAFKTARALTEHAEAERAESQANGSSQPEGSGADAEEDASARRYARLLVSEIKLYHEPAVVEGRRDRDLTSRLGGEMARARAMYEQRVPPQVRARADYFHDELVRTLCHGDASLLT